MRRAPGSPRRILVVEDDNATRDMYREALVDAGYEVMAAQDGTHAVRLLRHAPDLVMLDLTMPLMDGVQFLGRLRQDADSAHIPVLIVTGGLSEIRPEMAGAHLLSKPFDIGRLLHEIAQLLSPSALP